jgi:hypothetical protein
VDLRNFVGTAENMVRRKEDKNNNPKMPHSAYPQRGINSNKDLQGKVRIRPAPGKLGGRGDGPFLTHDFADRIRRLYTPELVGWSVRPSM